MTARLPKLPYQVVIKLMTLAADPVGIDEQRRRAAVPRQLYDLDGLTAALDAEDWPALHAYCASRYAYECDLLEINAAAGEPFAGITARLSRWAECLDPSSAQWRTISAVQSSQLQKPAWLPARGWRARAHRLEIFAKCVQVGPSGWETWQTARDSGALVPLQRAKAFRAALAELTGLEQSQLPLELHDLVWEAMALGGGAHVGVAERVLRTAVALLEVESGPARPPA
jgi:hypothetical protein